MDDILKEILGQGLASEATRELTLFSCQIGHGFTLKEIRPALAPHHHFDGKHDATSVTAFAIQNRPDKVSVRFLPPDTIMQWHGDYFMIDRTAWDKILAMKEKLNISPAEDVA